VTVNNEHELHLDRSGMIKLAQEIAIIRHRCDVIDRIIIEEMEKRRKEEQESTGQIRCDE
jgi:hypothetical protein